MKGYKVRALVLKETNVGESNKQLVVLSKEHGRLLLSAKGAKKPKSKLMSSTSMFCYSDFVIYEGRGFNILSQGEVIESFYNLRNDIKILSYASYIVDIVEKTIKDGVECDEILELILRTFFVLSKGVIDCVLATRIFEIKYLQYSGYSPEYKNCCICRKENVTDFISVFAGGVVCNKCATKQKDAFRLLNGTYKALEYILKSDLKDIFKFKVSDEVLSQLSVITKRYIDLHIGMRFKTLEFAENI